MYMYLMPAFTIDHYFDINFNSFINHVGQERILHMTLVYS